MALKPQDNSGFLREVDEEVRREQAAEFWRRWGLWVAIGVVLLLAAIGGWMYWSNQQRATAEAETQQLDEILDDLGEGQTQDIADRLEPLIESSQPGIRAAAMFTRASYALQSGDVATATELYGRAAADEELPQPYRDLALIRQTSLQFEELEPARVVERLSDLAEPGNPWFGSAGELTALALMKQGQNDRAARLFAEISRQEDLPDSLRARAVQMAGILGVDAVPDEPVEIEEADVGAGGQPVAANDQAEPAEAPAAEEEAE